LLLLKVRPFTTESVLEAQRLYVFVGKTLVGQFSLDQTSAICCRVPRHALEGPRVALRFEHPDATSPMEIGVLYDDREVAFAFLEIGWMPVPGICEATFTTPSATRTPQTAPPQSSVTLQDVMHAFTSIGDNCEFGLVQRRCDAESMSLMRLAATPYGSLMRMLKTGFADLLDPTQIMFQPAGTAPQEFILYHRDYLFELHTQIFDDAICLTRLFTRSLKSLFMGARLLLDDLAAGNRIFVRKHNHPSDWRFFIALGHLLQQYGPNFLLAVTLAEQGKQPGLVEIAGPGLLRGYIDQFLPYTAADGYSSSVWEIICCRAYCLWRPGTLMDWNDSPK
jgi:hypothetical protein